MKLLQHILHSYSIYKLFGAKSLPATLLASIGDNILPKYTKIEKNYLSLSVFWGYMSYNALNSISASKVPYKYKILTKLLFVTGAIHAIWKGNDFIASNYNTTNEFMQSTYLTIKGTVLRV